MRDFLGITQAIAFVISLAIAALGFKIGPQFVNESVLCAIVVGVLSICFFIPACIVCLPVYWITGIKFFADVPDLFVPIKHPDWQVAAIFFCAAMFASNWMIEGFGIKFGTQRDPEP